MENTDIDRIVQAIEGLAEPTSVEQNMYLLSGIAVAVSLSGAIWSLFTSYDISRQQSRIDLFRERKQVAKELELQLDRWSHLTTQSVPLSQVKMPFFDKKELKYLFNESVFELYNTLVTEYQTVIDNQFKVPPDPHLHLILGDIKDNRDELTEEIDYYLEIFCEPDKITLFQLIKIQKEEKRMRKIKKKERNARNKARKKRNKLRRNTTLKALLWYFTKMKEARNTDNEQEIQS